MSAAQIVWNSRRAALREIARADRMDGRVERALFDELVRALERDEADGSASLFKRPMWFEPFEGRHGGVMHLGDSPAELARRERIAAHRRRIHEDGLAAAAALGVDVDAPAEEVAAAQTATARRGATPVAPPAEGLARLAAATAAVAVAEAERLAAVVDLVGVEPCGSSRTERQKCQEVAIATGLSQPAAEALISRARLLHCELACFGAALAAGEVSFGHCLALIGQTATITSPETLTTVAEHALPFARRMVVSDFRRQVDALIAELDPEAEDRRRKAAARRTVYKRRDADGMSFLGVLHRTEIVNALYRQITDDAALLLDARRADAAAHEAATAHEAAAVAQDAPGSGTGTGIGTEGSPTAGIDLDAAARGEALADGDLAPDACRADALAARVLGTIGEDGSVTWDPSAGAQVTVEVVIDLDTLNGLADRVVLVDGEPVPAQVGRELAYVARWFRRVIVDPVDGHTLDYGDLTYIPSAVRRHCFARDRGCRAPNCTRRHARFLQLDHADEYPHGPSSSANCGALCTRCHQQKTAGLLDITDSRADGTATFTTPWGQTVRIPARPYLPRMAPAPERMHEPAPITVATDQPEIPPF
jgi:hypothetical protein